MRIFVLVGLLFQGAAFADESINYNNGFCVEAGLELNKSNAILVLEGNMLDGRKPLSNPNKNQQFFKPSLQTQSLMSMDWGGEMSLTKNDLNSNGSFSATYANHLHGYDISETKVTCIADGESKTEPCECHCWANLCTPCCEKSLHL